jgi:hypothetical protein
MIDGVPCFACQEAYEHQKLWFDDPNSIIFVGDDQALNTVEGASQCKN